MIKQKESPMNALKLYTSRLFKTLGMLLLWIPFSLLVLIEIGAEQVAKYARLGADKIDSIGMKLGE